MTRPSPGRCLVCATLLAGCAMPGSSPGVAQGATSPGRIASYCYALPRQQVLDRVNAHFAKCYAKPGPGHSSYFAQAGPEGGRLAVRSGIREVLVAQLTSGAQRCFASLEVRAVDDEWAARFAAIDAAAKGEAGGC